MKSGARGLIQLPACPPPHLQNGGNQLQTTPHLTCSAQAGPGGRGRGPHVKAVTRQPLCPASCLYTALRQLSGRGLQGLGRGQWHPGLGQRWSPLTATCHTVPKWTSELLSPWHPTLTRNVKSAVTLVGPWPGNRLGVESSTPLPPIGRTPAVPDPSCKGPEGLTPPWVSTRSPVSLAQDTPDESPAVLWLMTQDVRIRGSEAKMRSQE